MAPNEVPAGLTGDSNGPVHTAPNAAAEEGGEPAVPERAAWGRKLEFMLTCIGYAVGLGNVWRFPYLCFKNGGGAFLIPYVLMLAIIGMPMFYFELSLGQFSSSGPLKVWSIAPFMKGVGCCMVSTSWVISLYYNVIITWAFYFLFRSMTGTLPWTSCANHTWATDLCITGADLKELRQNASLLNQTMEALNITSTGQFKTPSEEFFYNEVLKRQPLDDMGAPLWELSLINLLCWALVFVVLIKGISTLGKAMYVVTIFPYIMMTILVVRGCTLEGASTGLDFYLIPKVERLLDAEVWGEAATQIFFSLSVCMGGLITMASYNKFHNAVDTDSLLVPVINCCTSFYSGFAIFSVLGYMANEKDVDVADVAAAGPGLVFVVYPEALSQMPLPTLWSILFFIMLIMLGFSSQFSIVETVLSAVMDEIPFIHEKPRNVIIFRLVACIAFFLLSLPMLTNGGFYLFEIVEHYSGTWPLLLIAICELVTVMWIYRFERFAEDIQLMIGRKPNMYFRICWTILGPAVLVVLTVMLSVQYMPFTVEGYEMTTGDYVLGWMIVVFLVQWVPSVATYSFCRYGGFQTLTKLLQPEENWGPAKVVHRRGTLYEDSPLDKLDEIRARNRSITIGGLIGYHDNPVFEQDRRSVGKRASFIIGDENQRNRASSVSSVGSLSKRQEVSTQL